MNSIYAFKKAMRVVDSCTNKHHTDAARTYINLFFRSYLSSSYTNKLGFTTYLTDEMVGTMYDRLLRRLTLKENSFDI